VSAAKWGGEEISGLSDVTKQLVVEGLRSRIPTGSEISIYFAPYTGGDEIRIDVSPTWMDFRRVESAADAVRVAVQVELRVVSRYEERIARSEKAMQHAKVGSGKRSRKRAR